MKKTVFFLLFASAFLLTACTRDMTTTSPSASPKVEVSATPDPALTDPVASSQPAGSTAAMKDGVYTAEVSTAYAQSSGHGWKEYLKITVNNAQITSVEYDALKDGKKKSEASNEEYPMTPHPSEWIPRLNDAIQAAEMPEAMDTVAGATMSSNVARQLYAAVLNAASQGNTATVIIEIS